MGRILKHHRFGSRRGVEWRQTLRRLMKHIIGCDEGITVLRHFRSSVARLGGCVPAERTRWKALSSSTHGLNSLSMLLHSGNSNTATLM